MKGCTVAAVDFESLIYDIPDYPTPGVVFKDITPLLGDAEGFSAAVDALAEHFSGQGVTKIVGAEARGFAVGAALAYKMKVGFVPARKPGKLPRKTVSAEYALEYGTDELQVHADGLTSEDSVLIIDDLLATGGTAAAQVCLVEKFRARLVGLGFFMELEYLNPRDHLAKVTNADVFTLVKVK